MGGGGGGGGHIPLGLPPPPPVLNISVGGVIDIQTTITKKLPVAVALKFTVYVVQRDTENNKAF